MKISVAIPSYNHGAHIGETLESILSQDVDSMEVCIVDDGSSDDSVNIIRQFKDPRIKLHCFEKNRGASIALNEAIKMASGEYIAVCNSDDCFLPGKLKLQQEYLDRHPQIHATFGIPRYVDQSGNPVIAEHYKDLFRQKNRTRHEWLNHLFFRGNCFCHATAMVRRECYEAVGYLDPLLFQLPDFHFWIKLLFKYDIHVIDEEIALFRMQGGVSFPDMKKRHRTRWEQSIVLEEYLNIRTVDEFKKIFPGDYVSDDTLVPFYLAREALSAPVFSLSVYRNFGLRTLFNVLHDAQMREKIEDQCGYILRDFISDTGNAFVYPDSQEDHYITAYEQPFFQVNLGKINLRLSKARIPL